MMTSFERLTGLWTREGIDIEKVIREAPAGSYSKVTDEFFWIAQPQHYRDAVRWDCWFLVALAGDMRAAWEHEPFPLPWYAWERTHGGRIRLSIWPRERLRALTGRHLAILPNHDEVAVTFTD